MRSRSLEWLFALVACTPTASPPPIVGTTTGTAGDSGDARDDPVASGDGATTSAAASDDTTTQTGGETGADVLELPPPQNVAAYGANGQVGIEWDRVEGATRYDIFWSMQPNVDPARAQAVLDVTPGFIHEDRDNGTSLHYVVVASDGEHESAPSVEVTATPGGTFMFETLGTGRLEDIVTGAPLSVPIEQRVHVVLLPEGYRDDELDTFESDIDEWRAEILTIDPYASFAPAFVVWKLRAASAEHVSAGDPQPAETAFAVPLAGGGVADVESEGPTATRIWAALADFPYPPTQFYPSGGATTQQAKTLLAHVLVYHPEQGNSGFSGRARRMNNPADPTQKLSVAFAHSRAHEFSHAFARLQDEYMSESLLGESNAMTVTSAHVSNVVTDSDCDTLPWRHLLFGTDLNPMVDELIGAFGRPQTGYHPELRCLMNGDTGNAEAFGGDGELRIPTLCNFCTEIATLRLFERIGVLDDPATSLTLWTDEYRDPYYARFGLTLPAAIPQRNSDGDPIFMACTP